MQILTLPPHPPVVEAAPGAAVLAVSVDLVVLEVAAEHHRHGLSKDRTTTRI
jgi:hypothetical protein